MVGLLNKLSRNLEISAAIERRNVFVHGLQKRDWRLLKASGATYEGIAEPSGVLLMEQGAKLGLLQRERRAAIDAICERLAQFRYDLITGLKGAAAKY